MTINKNAVSSGNDPQQNPANWLTFSHRGLNKGGGGFRVPRA